MQTQYSNSYDYPVKLNLLQIISLQRMQNASFPHEYLTS